MVNFRKESILGLYENIEIMGKDKIKKLKARIDSGATKSSIDISLAAELNLGPVVGIKRVKNSMGETDRPMIRAKIRINNRLINARFTLSDRKHLKYPVLIGQNILKMGFIIDPQKYRTNKYSPKNKTKKNINK